MRTLGEMVEEARRTGVGPQDTITGALARAVAAVPDRVFLDFGGDLHTFAQVDRAATEIAHGLKRLGVEPGQTVATILNNNIDAVTVWLGINKAGAVSAPVNTAYRGQFLRAQVHDCSAAVLIAESEYCERAAAIAEELPNIRHMFARGGVAPTLPNIASGSLDDLRVRDGGPIEDTATPDQLAMLVYTSGTTGASKGCMVSHNHACTMGWRAMLGGGNSAEDVLWTPLPLFHLNAIGVSVLGALIAQCRAAITPRFSVSAFWPDIERSGATSVALLGSMASLIADAPDNDSSRRCYGKLRRVQASPFSPPVVKLWRERFGVNVSGATGYGMTEAATIAGLSEGEPPGPPGSSGKPGRDFEVKIFDDNDNEVAPNTPGEIVCRPRRPNIMFQGYWGRPADTVKVWRNLWFHTGDIGRIDENGYFFFVDRKKDYIRRRGENISTHEMEAVFREHPAIQDVAIHAVLSPMGEDEVKVTAEVKPDVPVTEQELCLWSIERVPYFAVPQYVEFRESLPRSATGKVLKEQLRAEGKTAATWDREAAGVTFKRR